MSCSTVVEKLHTSLMQKVRRRVQLDLWAIFDIDKVRDSTSSTNATDELN